MFRRIVLLSIILLSIFISGCSFVKEERIVGKYYLIANDDIEDMHLAYSLEDGNYIGLVNATVFYLGRNADYIFVKQHPRIFDNSPDTSKIYYYIVPIHFQETYNPEKGIIGPLNYEQYTTELTHLNIKDAHFSYKVD